MLGPITRLSSAKHRALALACAAALSGGCAGDSVGTAEDFDTQKSCLDVGSWEQHQAMPKKRAEVAVVSLGETVYVLGGLTPFATAARSVFAYDTNSGQWSERADIPDGMHHINATTANGKIYVLGYSSITLGENPVTAWAFRAEGRVFEYDPAVDEWSEGRAMPDGEERAASATVTVGDDIYVIGGRNSDVEYDTVTKYDLTTQEWSAMPPLPEALDHLSGGVIDGIIYVAGGRHIQPGAHTPAVFSFDPSRPDDGWSTDHAPMPTSRGGYAATVYDGQLVVFGGEGEGNYVLNRNIIFDQVEAYDPRTDSWVSWAPLPTPRHGIGATVIDGRIYVPAGDPRHLEATNVNEVLVPPQCAR